jgi:hypothetical protein
MPTVKTLLLGHKSANNVIQVITSAMEFAPSLMFYVEPLIMSLGLVSVVIKDIV